MIKFVIKLVIVALLANAAWRVGNAYLAFYRFNDALAEASQFDAGQVRPTNLRQKVLELADQYDVPLDRRRLHGHARRAPHPHQWPVQGRHPALPELHVSVAVQFDVDTVNPMRSCRPSAS